MKVRTLVIVGGALVVAMLAVSAWAWPQIPAGAEIPIHWGVDGQPDGFGPKWVGLIGIPLVGAATVGLLALLPRIEPRRRNLERSGTAYVAVGIVVIAFLAVLHLFAVLSALGNDADFTALATIGSGVLFIVIGNFLGKTRSSWFFGIRTPWTLSSERSWTRTHRVGGVAFIVVGAIVVLATIVVGVEVAMWALLGGMGAAVIGLAAYSYVVWRDDPDRSGTEVTR